MGFGSGADNGAGLGVAAATVAEDEEEEGGGWSTAGVAAVEVIGEAEVAGAAAVTGAEERSMANWCSFGRKSDKLGILYCQRAGKLSPWVKSSARY